MAVIFLSMNEGPGAFFVFVSEHIKFEGPNQWLTRFTGLAALQFASASWTGLQFGCVGDVRVLVNFFLWKLFGDLLHCSSHRRRASPRGTQSQWFIIALPS